MLIIQSKDVGSQLTQSLCLSPVQTLNKTAVFYKYTHTIFILSLFSNLPLKM